MNSLKVMRLNLTVFVKSNNVQDKLTQYRSSNEFLLGNSPLNINIFLDDFSAYCSLAQDNWRSAGHVDDGGTFSARSITQINDGVNFVADLFSNFGSSCAFRCAG